MRSARWWRCVGGMRTSGEPIQDKEHFAMFAKSLKKGESYIVLAGTNVLAEGVKTRSLAQVNHYVVVGRDAGGKIFLYDPYPRVGTQLLRSGDPNFWSLFETADGRWKASYIFVRPNF